MIITCNYLLAYNDCSTYILLILIVVYIINMHLSFININFCGGHKGSV